MRGPTRLRITWLDDDTLKLETDYGMQTRLLRVPQRRQPTQAPSLQGVSVAQWIMRGRRPGPRRRPLRLDEVSDHEPAARLPAEERRPVQRPAPSFTEYWDVHTETNGDKYLVVTNIVDDPTYLQAPWITALHFKKEADGSKWNPEPCDARF